MKTGNRCPAMRVCMCVCVSCEVLLRLEKGRLKLVIGSCILVWMFKRTPSPPPTHFFWNTITGKYVYTAKKA